MLKLVTPILFLILFTFCSELDSVLGDNEEESDNNDKIESAVECSAGEIQAFKIDREGDVDYYRVKIEESGLYYLDVDSVPSSIALYISIFDKEQEDVDHGSLDKFNGGGIPLGFQLVSGECFIKINASYNDASNTEMYFSINRDLVDTFELNESFQSAYNIEIDEYYQPKINPDEDKDYFTFSIDSDQIFRIQVDSVSSRTNMMCTLYNDEYQEETPMVTIKKESSLDWGRVLKKGTYYLKFSAGYNQYADLTYRFIVKSDTTDKTEWNGDTSNAYPVELNEAVHAAIYPAGDEDYFKFFVDEPDTIVFTVDSISSALSYLRLSLYDDDFEGIDLTGSKFDEMLQYKKYLPTGNYYTKLTCGSLSSQSSFKNYVFTISTLD